MTRFSPCFLVAAALTLFTGCAGTTPPAAVCTAGETRPCTCVAGTGTQSCDAATGAFAACQCAGNDLGPGVCGDQVCNPGETCETCPDDCGVCPMCDDAPSCSDAVGVPTMTLPRTDLDIPPSLASPPDMAGGGASTCDTPQLRIRLSGIHSTKAGSIGGAQVYCIVNASDGTHSEVAVTTKTSTLGDGVDFSFDPAVGVFWGQSALQKSSNNLTITYNCFHVKGDSWAMVLQAAGSAAAMVGGVAGPYGWVFGVAAVGADVAGAAVQAASGDELRLNAQQTIDKSNLLDLTNGRTWTIHESGGGITDHFDWTLNIQSWGCANAKSLPE